MKNFIDLQSFYKHQLDIKRNRVKDTTSSVLSANFNTLDGDTFNSNSPIAYLLLKKQLRNKESKNCTHQFVGIINNEVVPRSFTMGRVYRVFDNIAKHKSLKCEYCHKDLKLSEVTFDHFIPQADGGKDSKGDNLFISCQHCNVLKGAINPYKHKNLFLVYLQLVRQNKYVNPKQFLEALIAKCTKEEFIFLIADKKQTWKFEEWMLAFNYIVTTFSSEELKNAMKKNYHFRQTMYKGKRILKKGDVVEVPESFSSYFYFNYLSEAVVKARISNNKIDSKNGKNRIYTNKKDIERFYSNRLIQMEKELMMNEDKGKYRSFKLSKDKVRYLKNEIMIYKEQLKIMEYKVE